MLSSPLRIVGFLAAILMTVGIQPAHANVGPELARIDPDLKDLPMGKPREALHDWFKTKIDRAALTTIAGASDYAEKERLRAQRDQRLAALTQGEVFFDEKAFTKDRSWEVSLIAGEFGRGTEESMIVWRQPGETLYFFLRRGVLWKVARQLDLDDTFEHRRAHWSAAFASEGAGAGKGTSGPTELRWPRDTLDVRLVNRRLLYGGDLLIIESRAVAEELIAQRAEAAIPDVSNGKVSHDLDDFFLPDNER